mmetsp:Transcript_16437/g.45355  ORF Transcript_16437/g.45355 Transcript_16437/m.45355 type:complete len:275 (+) Transcript_16437:103-927(+)
MFFHFAKVRFCEARRFGSVDSWIFHGVYQRRNVNVVATRGDVDGKSALRQILHPAQQFEDFLGGIPLARTGKCFQHRRVRFVVRSNIRLSLGYEAIQLVDDSHRVLGCILGFRVCVRTQNGIPRIDCRLQVSVPSAIIGVLHGIQNFFRSAGTASFVRFGPAPNNIVVNISRFQIEGKRISGLFLFDQPPQQTFLLNRGMWPSGSTASFRPHANDIHEFFAVSLGPISDGSVHVQQISRHLFQREIICSVVVIDLPFHIIVLLVPAVLVGITFP